MNGLPLGELASLGSAACWSVSALLFAHLTTRTGPMELNFAKCVIASVLMSLTHFVLGGGFWPDGLDGSGFTWLSASGLTGLTLGDTLYFIALQRIGPRRSLLLAALAPPITAVLSWPILGEPITGGMLLGMAVTLTGVAWVIRERAPVGDKTEFSKLLLATFVGTYAGIWMQVTGLTYAPAAVATTLSSTSPVFVLPLGAVFLGERATPRAVIGAFVAVLGVALMVVV